MYKRVFLLFLAILPSLLNAQENFTSNPKSKLTIDGLIQFQFVRSPRISPNGKLMLYVEENNDSSTLLCSSITDNKDAKKVIEAPSASINQIFWIDDVNFILEADLSQEGVNEIFLSNINSTQTLNQISQKGSDARIIDVNRQAASIVITYNQLNPSTGYYDQWVYRVNDSSKVLTINNTNNFSNLLTDYQKGMRVGVFQQEKSMELFSAPALGGSMESSIQLNKGELLIPLKLNSEQASLYALSNINRNFFALVNIDPSSGKEIETIYENAQADVVDVQFSTRTGLPLWCTTVKDKVTRQEGLNPTMKTLLERIGPLVQSSFVLENCDDSELIFSVKKISPFGNPSYEIVNLKNSSVSKPFILPNASLDKTQVSKTLSFNFTTSDGKEIKSTLNTPRQAKYCPLVIIIDDNKTQIGDVQMDPLVQVLTSRGKAVLRISPPGTFGYGKNYLNESFELNDNFFADLIASAQARINKEMGIECQSTYLLVFGNSSNIGNSILQLNTKQVRSIALHDCLANLNASNTTLRNAQWSPFGQIAKQYETNRNQKSTLSNNAMSSVSKLMVLGLYKNENTNQLLEILKPSDSIVTEIPHYLLKVDQAKFYNAYLTFLDK